MECEIYYKYSYLPQKTCLRTSYYKISSIPMIIFMYTFITLSNCCEGCTWTLSLTTYCVGCMSNSQVFNWVSCRESWFFKRENFDINFTPNGICMGSMIWMGSMIVLCRVSNIDTQWLTQTFLERNSLNILSTSIW